MPVFYGYHILRADGEKRVRTASIAKIGRDATLLPDTEKRYDVDAVCIGYALHPSNELARSLGCEHDLFAPGLAGPVRDRYFQTTIEGVFVIGDGGVLGGAHVAMAEGRLAARAVLGNLKNHKPEFSRRDQGLLRRHRRFQRHLWSMYEAPDVAAALPDTPLCRCEMVTLDTVTRLIDSGVHDLGNLKRLCRAGMGPCQGRYCQKSIATILADMTGTAPTATDMLAPQLPVKPTLISNVAAEKPEWHGYRSVAVPRDAPRTGASASPRTETHVLVIGAGIIGISTALFLARKGIEVVIVDRDVANGQASGGNAGSLHLQLLSFDFPDQPQAELSPAARTLTLQKMGILEWLDLERKTGADFELDMTGGLMVAESPGELELLRKKAAFETSCGIDVEILSASELKKVSPFVASSIVGAAYCAGEGKINPMLATPALAECCPRRRCAHRNGNRSHRHRFQKEQVPGCDKQRKCILPKDCKCRRRMDRKHCLDDRRYAPGKDGPTIDDRNRTSRTHDESPDLSRETTPDHETGSKWQYYCRRRLVGQLQFREGSRRYTSGEYRRKSLGRSASNSGGGNVTNDTKLGSRRCND